MSYIRCLSNPEALYVWEDIDDNTYFSWSQEQKNLCIKIPSTDIKKFFLALYKLEFSNFWQPDIGEPFFCGNFSVSIQPKNFKVKLSFGSLDLIMWPVTWEYLKNSFFKQLIGELTFSIPWYRKIYQQFRRWLQNER